MSRPTFLLLCEDLRPFVQKESNKHEAAVDVERQVASPLYYLSDEGRIKKTANAFGLSRSVISNIIRRVCIAITVHLESKYIKLPFTEAEVTELVSKFYQHFQSEHRIHVDRNQSFCFHQIPLCRHESVVPFSLKNTIAYPVNTQPCRRGLIIIL